MIAKEISPVFCLLFFSVNCQEHQAHLVAKNKLNMMQTVCGVTLSQKMSRVPLDFCALLSFHHVHVQREVMVRRSLAHSWLGVAHLVGTLCGASHAGWGAEKDRVVAKADPGVKPGVERRRKGGRTWDGRSRSSWTVPLS